LGLAALIGPVSLLACSSLIGLGDLDKAECVECRRGGSGAASAGGLSGAAPSGGGSSGGGSAGPSSGRDAGTTGGGASNLGGSSVVSGGTMGYDVGGDGNENVGGGPPNLEVCPGGPEPPLSWTEHWYEHGEQLTRVYYDACIALYFDRDVTPAAQDWLVPFLDQAWSYSLASYGTLGNERLYVVVHQGKHPGGHSATYDEGSHDHHNVIDMGAAEWPPGTYDLPAHLMGFIVDTTGAHTKLGSAMDEHYGNEGFPLIYKYDLYVALGLTDVANAAHSYFNTLSNNEPYPGTYWYRDWFYPLWRDHGHVQVFVDYMELLQDQAPVDAGGWLDTLNYGQYFHFMSGAAGQDLEPLARQAFEWRADFDEEISSAKEEFPEITY
jgi:hypothetical protein